MEGHTLFRDETGELFWWKDCVVPGCENQVCRWLSETKCHPHAQNPRVKEIIEQAVCEPATC